MGPVSELLGGELVLDADTEGAKVPVADLASKHLLLYFSTPKLAEAYKAYKEKGLDLEVVFVSSDRDETSFGEYFGEMPWLALPYADRDRKSALSKAFDVEGIPTLVVLGPVDAATGEREVVNKNARGAVGGDPTGADFPWAPKPIADLATTTECNGSDINETPSLVVFVEGCNDDAQAEAVKAMETWPRRSRPRPSRARTDRRRSASTPESRTVSSGVFASCARCPKRRPTSRRFSCSTSLTTAGSTCRSPRR